MILIEQLDLYLAKKGMKEPLLRRIFKNLFIFSFVVTVMGLLFFAWTPALFWVGVFSIISGCNFYFLARSILKNFFLQQGKENRANLSHPEFVKKNIILGSFFRLFILGIFLYNAIIYGVNIIAVALGISAPVIIIVFSICFNRSFQE